MTEKQLCYWIRFIISAIGLLGLGICIGWLPTSLSSAKILIPLTYSEIWIQLIFYWTSAVPCFIVLSFGWKISSIVKEKGLFVYETAKYVNLSAKLLFADMLAFLLGNLVFLFIGNNTFPFLYFFVAIVGFLFSLLLGILSHYLSKAAFLQEESEGTI